MMLSQRGNQIFQKVFNRFRQAYLEHNPGCNDNDIERAFLFGILIGSNQIDMAYGDDRVKAFDGYNGLRAELITAIASIR